MIRLAIAIACLPVVALAADVANTATPGAGAGVWAAAGAFLGQLAAAKLFVSKQIAAHVATCPKRSEGI